MEQKTEKAGTVPHVYQALAQILKSLSVEKNGVLPGTMGGKPYITAVDASAEVKRQFVANNLVFVPSERVVRHESIVHKDRLNLVVVVEGNYEIISTVDGSIVSISGVGDGLALSTAVASNIASTNALKNALLRTFLITEQSVEDEGKNGATEAPASTAVKKATATPTGSYTTKESPTKKAIREEFVDKGIVDRDTVNRLVKTVRESGATGDTVFDEVLNKLRAGEVG